ncbi:MAG: PAS domain-containing protein [Rhodocyclaceae bacterium]|nr:MAG: PAS domain-containing protein [Rhodocyclaceae bacterium]
MQFVEHAASMRTLPIAPSSRILRWLLSLSILAAAVVMLYPLNLERQYPLDGTVLTLAIAGLLIAALVVYFLTIPHGVAIIHRGIRHATEGTLKPIETPRRIRFFFGPIVDDYNILIRNIGSLFREMEQSQLAIIGDRNRNDAILRSLPGALLTVDSDFRVTLSNKQAEQLFCLDNDGLLGKNLFELLPLNEDGKDLLREAFLYEQQVNNKEIVLSDGNGARHFTLNVTFFRQSQDAIGYCAAVMLQDITDYKRLQELIHQSEKFLAIGQLAGGVAHELNTPLGTIVGYAQLLKEGVASEERRLEYGERIYREAKRCSQIIENLRAVAQRDVCCPETCSIDAVIADVVDSVNNCPSKTHNATIVTSLACDAAVHGGPGQLDIVLVNVVMNAVQAATAASEDPRVTIISAIHDDNVQVSISDNGPGIPAAQRNQVFDPFFTTKKDCAGIGLGLAISQSIVTRLGGSLSCDADCAEGARFLLTLPLAERKGR